jgi:hypothetical protein
MTTTATAQSARVDVLTAGVRVLQVGSRQVTLSVYRQPGLGQHRAAGTVRPSLRQGATRSRGVSAARKKKTLRAFRGENGSSIGRSTGCPLKKTYAVAVPRRSTPFQAIVHLVRQHYAGPGVKVTESKFLHDPEGGEREVDIVVEAEADGDPVVISLEVNQKGRPASVEWVEQQIGKHSRLPTNKLVLVSRAGFSRKALTRVALENGKVEAIQPEIVTVDGQPVVRRLFMDSISHKPTGCTVHVRGDDGERVEVRGAPDTGIYDGDGALLGPLVFLVQEAAGLESVGRWLSVEAHHHPEREDLKAFTLLVVVVGLGYHLKREDTGTLHQILALKIWGDFMYRQDEVTLTLSRLGDRVYAAGEAPFAGRPAVWVGTPVPGSTETKVSWRATDVVAPPSQHESVEPPKRWFPDLLKITMPEHPKLKESARISPGSSPR